MQDKTGRAQHAIAPPAHVLTRAQSPVEPAHTMHAPSGLVALSQASLTTQQSGPNKPEIARVAAVAVIALGSLILAFWLGTRFANGWPFGSPPSLPLTTWAVPTSISRSDSSVSSSTYMASSTLANSPGHPSSAGHLSLIGSRLAPPPTAIKLSTHATAIKLATPVQQPTGNETMVPLTNAGTTRSLTPVPVQATATASSATSPLSTYVTPGSAVHATATAFLATAFSATALPSQQSGSLLNLNTATEEQMRAILHVRRKTAQLIIAYRTAHGPFHAVNDLLAIPLSKTTVRRLSKLATVQ